MHAPAFVELITQLCAMGHSDSKFISLEEQLAIFLYTLVTGLSVRHVGERFQHSNETISKYIKFISRMQWISDSSAYFARSSLLSPPNHSIQNMSSFLMGLSLAKSTEILSGGLFLKAPLVQ
jgi:hypothetical protein